MLQLIATPFAYGSIYLGPTGAMVTLAISYLFGKLSMCNTPINTNSSYFNLLSDV